jgi:hypothetical protein
MTTSEEMLAVAMWMMILGGTTAVIGLMAVLVSDSRGRGDLSKPLTFIGTAIFLLGVFFDYQWGTFW